MKVLLLVLFFGITRIFSINSGFSKISDNNLKILYDSKYSEYEPVSLNNLGIWKNEVSESDKFFKLMQTLSNSIIPDTSSNLDFTGSNIHELTKRDAGLTPEEVFLLEALSSYLGSGFSKQNCVTIMNMICPQVATYPGISENIRSTMEKKCQNKDETCETAKQKLPAHCDDIKSQLNSNALSSKEFCDIYQPKCMALRIACNKTLDEVCDALDKKCSKKETPTTVIGDQITNAHTIIVDKTIYETETVTYTKIEVVHKVKTCCNDKPYLTTCKPKTTHHSEHSNDGECSVTLTTTVTSHGETFTTTITVISGEEGSKTDTITDKGDSTKIDGLRKIGLIYLIVGITAGIWIVV